MKRLHINVKEDKGASSVLVLLTVLIFVCILTGVFAIVATRAGGQMKSDMRIQEIYQNEVDRADEIYDEVISKITSYNITYNLNGGTGVSNSTYTASTPTFTLPIPVKENYKFLGWTGSNGNEPELEVIITKGTTGDKTYIANWQYQPYKIIGEIETTSTGNYSASVKVKIYDENIEEDVRYDTVNGTQEKDYGYFTLSYGRTLVSWRVTASPEYEICYSTTESVEDPIEVDNLEWEFTNTVHYYIIKGEQYTITCNLGGAVGTTTIKYGKTTPTFTLQRLFKQGYYFQGWTGSNGDVPQLDVTITKGTTGNKEYTANWVSSDYSILGEIETVSTGGQDARVKVKMYTTHVDESFQYNEVNSNRSKDYEYFKVGYGLNGTRWRAYANEGYSIYYATTYTNNSSDYTLGNPLEWAYNTSIHYYIAIKNN